MQENLLRKILFAETREEAKKLYDQFICDYDTEKSAKLALGYHSGYYSQDVRIRLEEFLGISHPIFGKVGGPNDPKNAEDALALGFAVQKYGLEWEVNLEQARKEYRESFRT